MRTALQEYGTADADGLGRGIPSRAGGATFAFGVEEQLGVLLPAGPLELPLPVVQSGAGEPSHFAAAFRAGASGALAASVFHDRRIAIPHLKTYLAGQDIEVRP